MTQKARLKWQCRRGMRELDLLLEEFLEHRYETLSEADRDAFVRLLECPNEDLISWLVEGNEPQSADLVSIAEQVRDRASRDL